MIGDTVISEGVELEIVWDGGEGLIPDRPSKVTEFWTSPHRLYNKTGKYSKKKASFERCEECGALVPTSDAVSPDHAEECSLHPTNIVDSPDKVIAYLAQEDKSDDRA